MSELRRSVAWIAALLIVTIAGDRILASVLHKVLVRSQFRFSRLYRGGNDAEVLIVGDSRGVHSFYAPAIEEITGKRAFNLSYNSMDARIAEPIVLDYLERNRAPKIVIIELTSVIHAGALVSQLRTYAGLSPRLMAVYSAAHPRAAAAGRVFRLFPLNSEFYLEALHYMRRSDQDWIYRSSIPAGLRFDRITGRIRARPENMEPLGRLVRALRERGVEVHLIIAPYYRWAPGNMPEFLGPIAPHLPAGDPGVHVHNYITALDDPELFADRVHLNESGSRAFIQILKRDGVFRKE